MKRLIPTTLIAFTLLTSTSAFANDVNLDINIGGGAPQPVIVAPPAQTVIVEHPGNYDPHHTDRDRKYWEKRKEEERKEQERKEREHREHEQHEHEHEHEHNDHHDDHDDQR